MSIELSKAIGDNKTVQVARFFDCGLTDKSGDSVSYMLREHLTHRDQAMWALELRSAEGNDITKRRKVHASGLCFLELG